MKSFLILSLAVAQITLPLYKVTETKPKDNSRSLSQSDLINHSNFYYTAKISLGTPPQTVYLRVSTGTAISWVIGEDCTTCTGLGISFKESESTSGQKKSSEMITYTYLSGSKVTGYYYEDKLSIGDTTSVSTNSSLIVASSITGFSNAVYSGILAMGLKNSDYSYNTLLDDLKDSGHITQKVFSLYLADLGYLTTYDSYGDFSSVLQIGTYSLSTYSTTNKILVTLPVISPYEEWKVQLDSVYLGSNKLAENFIVGISSINYIQANTEGFSKIEDALDNAKISYKYNDDGFIYALCQDVQNFYTLSFMYDDVKIDVSGSNLWREDGSTCTLLIYKNSDTCWWFGASFLHVYYAIFDADNLNIKLAPAKQPNDKITASASEYIMITGLAYLLVFS
ncbi:hypothetical protein SteCoe_14393 [Stentor coeruleus]|uniref:Peptidase A1 domain-containing protein n=1 Tax=Stentor coeruleus TaxID=5963 RepID=A0A1R2C645_9CILI|nr:hypothetical protein SteCoe_15303 [Stentor coeruleus]OMJ84504.1 hypothetical protein SteCoe_14393 [Stentor coeruleus]